MKKYAKLSLNYHQISSNTHLISSAVNSCLLTDGTVWKVHVAVIIDLHCLASPARLAALSPCPTLTLFLAVSFKFHLTSTIGENY